MKKLSTPSQLAIMAGRRLRAVRDTFDKHRPMRQEDFAAKLGVGRTTLANWEGGIALPDIAAMVRLYEWLGVPLEWIYLGQTRHVEYELAERLERRALSLGATVVGLTDEPAGMSMAEKV